MVLAGLGALLGDLGVDFGALECVLWRSCVVLEVFWLALKGFFNDLGGSWGAIGMSWGGLGMSWPALHAVLALPGAVLVHSWARMKRCCPVLGRSWAALDPPKSMIFHKKA